MKSIGWSPKASIGVFVTLATWEPFCFSLDQASPQPTSSPPCSSSAAILPTFVRRIAAEERMLTDQLGEEYSDYKAKTWKLIPFVF